MNDMKKLSMLAAGVAVLTMCACTEANEFTPSTNGNTKKITEIKVASNPSALGTRTEFDTSDNNFGVVTWEKGVDELYFFKDGTNSNPQIFTCGNKDDNDVTYDWNFFTANKGSWLHVDDSYYAYYFPAEGPTKYSEVKDISELEAFHYLAVEDDGSEDDVLKQFMHDYDLLLSSNASYPVSSSDYTLNDNSDPVLVKAQEEMDPIYMNHAFALITLDVECVGVGQYTNYDEMPSYYAAELVALADNGSKSCFATGYKINTDGSLEFVYSVPTDLSKPYICTNFDSDKNYYYLTDGKRAIARGGIQSKKLSFYFLVRNDVPVDKLYILLDTENEVEKRHTEHSFDKSLCLEMSKPFSFVSGNCYQFGLNVDYGIGVEDQNCPFNATTHWKNIKGAGQVTLATYPDGMSLLSVEDGIR